MKWRLVGVAAAWPAIRDATALQETGSTRYNFSCRIWEAPQTAGREATACIQGHAAGGPQAVFSSNEPTHGSVGGWVAGKGA